MTIQTTVVIPTCGAATHLADVLAGLARQTNQSFELIIVDNNFVPHVRSSIIEDSGLRGEVIHEEQNGLQHARNAGVKLAQGDYVAFLDDDAVPAPSWLANLVEGTQRYDAIASGGSVILKFTSPPPSWIGNKERALLSELLYSRSDIPALADDMYITGANMCVDRLAFDRIGLFDPEFDRTATSLRSSGDLEFARRLQAAGLRVAFIASAAVHHHIDPFRLTKRYLLARAYWQGRSDALLESKCGRPETFGRRDLRANAIALFGRLRDFVRGPPERNVIARELALAREYGYCLQRGLLRVAGPKMAPMTGVVFSQQASESMR